MLPVSKIPVFTKIRRKDEDEPDYRPQVPYEQMFISTSAGPPKGILLAKDYPDNHQFGEITIY